MFLRFDCFFLLIVFALCATSCGPSENERLEKEVLDIHDEVMPWLDDMKSMRRKLMKSEFKMSKDSSAAVNASVALHRADSMMWAWMYQYTPVDNIRDSMSEAQIHQYLLRQREYIFHVNTSMKNAVNLADELLNKKGLD